eukprot:3023041-Alexandrium_andersonii.AAC.1
MDRRREAETERRRDGQTGNMRKYQSFSAVRSHGLESPSPSVAARLLQSCRTSLGPATMTRDAVSLWRSTRNLA